MLNFKVSVIVPHTGPNFLMHISACCFLKYVQVYMMQPDPKGPEELTNFKVVEEFRMKAERTNGLTNLILPMCLFMRM